MVHALEEAMRVLKNHGYLVDVRPLGINIPLEIISDGESAQAGEIDLSPEVRYDIAADQAIVSLLAHGEFYELKHEIFDYIYYWNSVKEMREDIKKYCKDDVIITRKVWAAAKKLFNERRSSAQVRVKYQMKLTVFEKTGLDGSENPLGSA